MRLSRRAPCWPRSTATATDHRFNLIPGAVGSGRATALGFCAAQRVSVARVRWLWRAGTPPPDAALINGFCWVKPYRCSNPIHKCPLRQLTEPQLHHPLFAGAKVRQSIHRPRGAVRQNDGRYRWPVRRPGLPRDECVGHVRRHAGRTAKYAVYLLACICVRLPVRCRSGAFRNGGERMAAPAARRGNDLPHQPVGTSGS